MVVLAVLLIIYLYLLASKIDLSSLKRYCRYYEAGKGASYKLCLQRQRQAGGLKTSGLSS